jgi:non-lysosomal glucosylceramidase
VVNSHGSAPGHSVDERDNATGKLTSVPFVIARNFVTFWIGGGSHKGTTCLNLCIDGKVQRTATGHDDNRMTKQTFDVREFKGKKAVLEIVDDQKGPWGNIGVGRITFSDRRSAPVSFTDLPDYGTMGLALLGPPAEYFNGEGSKSASEKFVGEIGRSMKLKPGQSATVTFVLSWCFPNLVLNGVKGSHGRHYATRFASAAAMATYVAKNMDRLYAQTKLWRDTWYDSTLPYWFLDRTFLNASILATSTAFRFADGRFYGWEGVGCCAGTCTHVWQYEQAMGRLFPELDKLLRERADFDPQIGFRPDGMIDHRGEFNAGQAVDGQAGTILRAYRDHQVSADGAFLKRNYPAIKKAMQWLIKQDGNNDGILDGAQHNTLDAEWYGPVAWLSGLYLAALRATAEMARESGDDAFAKECSDIIAVGVPNFVKGLFNGEYFINKPDPKRLDAINSGTGCEIDQVMGQAWAFQVGLGRILPAKETRSALHALWKYNFSPDVGPYRKANKAGRWYAMPGEAGLLMCTFPRADWNYQKARGKGPEWATGYFNECMNGFEHQVAGHMIWEGMVQEGLAVERALHDRYGAARRNPWNEVECGDHYARSMASYGVFVAACGFEYHGPKGHIGFAPRLSPDDFKAAFTAAEGWGTYAQKRQGDALHVNLQPKLGRLRVKTLALTLPEGVGGKNVQVTQHGVAVAATSARETSRLTITLKDESIIPAGHDLQVLIV